MAQYTVTRACGHEEVVNLYGPNAQREAKIKWLESTVCANCYNAEGCDEVEMLYREYKENYADCKTKQGSYDRENKTIIVYVPTAETLAQHGIVDDIAESIKNDFAKLEMSEEQEKFVNENIDKVYQIIRKKMPEWKPII